MENKDLSRDGARPGLVPGYSPDHYSAEMPGYDGTGAYPSGTGNQTREYYLPEEKADKPKGRAGLWVAVVVALVLGWFLFVRESFIGPVVQGDTPRMEAPEVVFSVAPSPVSTTPVGDVADSGEIPEDGAQARQIISGLRGREVTPEMDALYRQAREYQAAGRLADAHLLYFYAAKRGHGDSAMMLASMADPAYFAEFVLFLDQPDPVQAVKWYQRALDAGIRDAAPRLAALEESLRSAAGNGDRHAQRLLFQLH